MKVVINKCFGGFSLSEAVYTELGLKWDGYGYPDNDDFGIKTDSFDKYNLYRSDPKLIAAIEKVGIDKSGGSCASLSIVDIPDGVAFDIDEYDGQESIHETHRSWS